MNLRSDVYNEDCMIRLPGYGDQEFNVGYFDTQYGILEDGRKSESRSGMRLQKNGTKLLVQSKHTFQGWDKEVMGMLYWIEARRVTQNQLIFGVNYIHKNIPFIVYNWVDKPPRREDYELFLKTNPVGYIIWDKCNGETDFSDCELIWTSFNRPSYIKYFMWNGMMQACDAVDGTRQQGNKALNQKRIHPTEKPILYNRWLLTEYAQPGQSLLDTHSGSQSMRIASYEEGLHYTGMETNTHYFNAGNSRYKNYISNLKLF